MSRKHFFAGVLMLTISALVVIAALYFQSGVRPSTRILNPSPLPKLTIAEQAMVQQAKEWAAKVGARVYHELPHFPTLAISTGIGPDALTDAHFESLKGGPSIRWLILVGCPITDKSLAQISTCANLESLELVQTLVTDNGVNDLMRLTKLRSLLLANTSIGDDGAKKLVSLPQLEFLGLNATKVTNASESTFRQFPNVRVSWDRGPRPTEAEMNELKKASHGNSGIP